jgi:serine/threonine-protein kinase
VLHRDLKPANILLDEQGEPYVADFGLAKRLDGRALASTPSVIAGTTGYMAPEQLKLAEKLTPAADIYGLGAILYKLLTGEVPLPSGLQPEQLLWLMGDAPVRRPRELNGSIDQNVERICLRCLEKTAKKRYQSALDVAVALERAVRPGGGSEPLPPLTQRMETWARRYPRRALVLGCAVLVCVVASLSGWWLWQADQRARRATLETNAFIAGSQAGAALAQLREYAERIALAARDPALARILSEGAVVDPAAAVEAHGNGFDAIALLSNPGQILAEWPSPDRLAFERNFAFRDYFQGARYLAEHRLPGAYVGRAFRAETKGLLVFAFSAPVLDENGGLLGVLVGTLNAKSVFGSVQMQESTGEHNITSALIGPRGPDRDTTWLPPNSELTFLVHPGLSKGREHVVARPVSSKLQATFGASAPPGKQFALRYVPPVKMGDYRDVVPGFSGPWLAAFAPVGNTGFVVLVQTRRAGVF